MDPTWFQIRELPVGTLTRRERRGGIAGRTTRRLRIATGFLAVALTLCGCERLVEDIGDVSVSRQGQAVLVAFCDAVEVQTVSVTAAHRGWGGEGFAETFYITKGDASLPEGFVLSTDEEIAGLNVELSLDPRLDEANEISVMADSDKPGQLIQVTFNFAVGTIPTDRWLRSDGSTSDDPC